MKKIIGFIEGINSKSIRGWALEENKGIYHPAKLTISTTEPLQGSEIFIKIETNIFRSDLDELYGEGMGGFSYNFPFEVNENNLSVFGSDGSKLKFLDYEANSFLHIDDLDGRFLSGWAKNSDSNLIELTNEDKKTRSVIYANKLRADLEDLPMSDENLGFSTRLLSPVGDRVKVKSGNILQSIKITSKLNVLIISESSDKRNPTRIYRCNHLLELINNDDMNINLISENEFWAGDFKQFDILILSRVGVDEAKATILRKYKTIYKCRIIYEVDDLIFLPWLASTTGAYRSGSINSTLENFAGHIRNKLHALIFCDAVITSSTKLFEIVNSLGFEAIKIPNLIKEKHLKYQDFTTKEPKKKNIIYLSGSNTHDNDFSEVATDLKSFLIENKDYHLTIVGRLNLEQFKYLKLLQNVIVCPYVEYKKMLELIANSAICLVPLENTVFNDCKSDLKFLECGSQSIPVIASSVREYSEVIVTGNNGILVNQNQTWLEVLNETLTNNDLVNRLGEHSYRKISTSRTVESFKLNNSKNIYNFIFGGV